MIDLTSLRTLETDDLYIRHPVTDEPTGWMIKFAGPGHPKTIALEDEALRRRLKSNKDFRLGGRKQDDDIDEVRNTTMASIAGRIISWEPDVAINGQTFAFTQDVAKKLLGDPQMRWLFTQCAEFLAASDSFFSKHPNGS